MKNKLTIFNLLVAFIFVGLTTMQAQTMDVQRPVSTSIADGGSDVVGNQATGTQFTLTYTILETASSNLDITAFAASGESNCTIDAITPSAAFTQTLNNSSMTVDVDVTVLTTGAFSFDIDITNTAGDLNYDIAVSGTGIPGEIDIQRPVASTIADGASDAIGTYYAGSAFVLTYTIEELISSDLIVSNAVSASPSNCTVNSITPSAAFSQTLNGSTMTFDVNVTPTAAGVFSFELDITSDDSDEGNYDLTVSGTAVALTPAGGAVDVSIQPLFEWVDPASGIAVSKNASYNPAVDSPGTSEIEDNSISSVTTYDASTQPVTLYNNTTYYWWVYDDGLTSWVSMGSFTTTQNVTPFLAAPVGGLQLNSETAQLYWNTSGHIGDFLFDIFYSTTQKLTYSGDTPQLMNLDHEIAYINNLTPGATYYWQVRVKDSNNNILGYSTVESFITYGVLTKPLPTYPLDDSETYTVDPYLYWTSYFYSTLIQYKVRYSTTADASDSSPSDGYLDNGASETPLDFDLYVQLTGLTGGTPYYWQVAATNDGGSTYVWSDIFTFNTPATLSGIVTSPTPSYPVGGITMYSSSVTFYWQPTSYNASLQYEVRYAKDDNTIDGNGMLTAGTSMSLTSSTFRQIAGLEGDATYYWQVRAYNGSAFSPWSVADNFVTDESVLNVQTPILLTPGDGQLVTTLEPTLYWYVNGNPNGYTFTALYNSDGAQDFNGNLSGTTNVLGGATTTDSYYAKFSTALADGGTYYWQIKAEKGLVTKYSSIRSFSVNGESTATTAEIPIPAYPIGGFTVITSDPVLNWVINGSYSNLEFEVLYSTDNSTSGGVLVNSGTATTAWNSNLSVALSNLTPGAVYYWQVRSRVASSPATLSNYSAVEYFIVSAGAGPSMAILGSPVGVEVKTTDPVLSWVIPSLSSSELTYEVEIAEDPSMLGAQTIGDITSNNVQVNVSDGKTYYWRVRSKTDNGEYSSYTGSGSFGVDQNVTEVEVENSIPTEFEVAQNYPNPFNPATTIRFSIPSSENVTVKIFDMLGSEIATLLNSDLEAGNHSVVWNGQNQYGSSVSSGVYFYRVISGNNVVTKKMLLMK